MPPNPTTQAILRMKQVSAWLVSLCVQVDSYSCSRICFCHISRIADKQPPITCTRFSSASDLSLQTASCPQTRDAVLHSSETNTVRCLLRPHGILRMLHCVRTQRYGARYTPSDSLITPYVRRNPTKSFAPIAPENIAYASTCP
ncbi:hypothetical protein BD309DRAFT_54183 [Dichomitus squalens]|uniref:Uncharacterized protein n=1 Tax=Dichomitus squalens TaxID=114155 RepID=A0A4V6MWJ0_9APHY|nr:hypothetical protein BD309DRAFT_54183 [Dichomitus squalens]TBU51836.1 hypothetical protein BD310DRAFT_279293 [Dichomitus squalens]